MTSRERLLAVLSFRPPDRVPISTYELVGYDSKSWRNNEPSYSNLMQIIREQTDCVCMWNPKSNTTYFSSSIKYDIKYEKYRESDATIVKRKLFTPKGELTSSHKTIDNIHTTWNTEHWCKTIDDVDKVLSLPYEPVKYDASDFQRIKTEVGDNGIIMPSLADALWLAADLMEFGEYTVWAMTETEHFEKTVKIMHERNIQNLKNMLEVNVADIYRICGPEYATPPYLPPEYFKRFVAPYVKEMVDIIHSKGSKVRLHCHGKIAKVLDLIIETGADAIDPCESPPDGDITLDETKNRCNGKLCVFGNIQLKLLESGSEKDVEDYVKKCIIDAKNNSGFVIMPTAGPINVPLAKKTEQNYIRFIKTTLEHGRY